MAGDEYFPIETGGGSGPRTDDRPAGRSGSSRGRVPPHNVDAEESVLGAMLLSWSNTWFYQELMQAIRHAINVGAYDQFRRAWRDKLNRAEPNDG